MKQKPKNASKNFMVKNGILYKNSHKYPYWRPVFLTDLEISVIRYLHKTFGHLGIEKFIAQIANTFRLKGLGRKVRTFICRCCTCQRVKYPNTSCAVQKKSHLLTKPGDLRAVDFYEPLPVLRFGFRYIYLCVSTFYRNLLSCTHLKLQQLRLASTKS